MYKILLVDDSREALERLAAVASTPEATVETASCGVDAIQRIKQELFDVIICDLRMETDTAGLDVLKAAKTRDVTTQVIVLTAYGTPEISIEAMALGAFDYLEKNSPGTDIYSMIESKTRLALEFRAAKLVARGA